MDMLMKIVMGGWIPEGKRTQWLAFATALCAIVMSLVQWGAGSMDFMSLMTLLQEKWAVLLAAYATYYVAEKVDRK